MLLARARSAVEATLGHQRTVAVTFELVALSDAERPVFGEQFEGGNFENRPEAEIRADLEIRGHQSDF